MAHIKTHVTTEEIARSSAQKENAPAEAQTPSSRNKRPKPRVAEPAQTIQLTYEETASIRDERNPNAPPQAAGIPLSAVLILRNIARNVGKTEAEEALLRGHDMDVDTVVGYKERLFRPVMGRLIEVFTENRLLAKDLTQLILIVDAKAERPRNYEN
jgi:chromatin structure-remodeling complex subunit RSC9